MLFWEALQCNKRFRSFIIDTDRAHDFLVLVLYYALTNRQDPSEYGLVRMCVFVLQTLSSEPNFCINLNKAFEGQATLPTSIRIPNFHGSYADFLITSLYTLLTTGNGKLDVVYPALLAVLKNIAAYLENLGRAPSSKLLQLFATMSSPSFLLANETNHDLLQAVLEAFNAIIEHQYAKNPNFVYGVLRASKRFQALRDFTLESGQEELERLERLRKERGTEMGSRKNSVESLRSPVSATSARIPSLSDVPEENSNFAIGDDEDSEDDEPQQTPSQSTAASADVSRAASVSSNTEDAVPFQLRGMSEKARGKLPIGHPSFSRQNSTTSLSSLTPIVTNSLFSPSADWVSDLFLTCVDLDLGLEAIC